MRAKVASVIFGDTENYRVTRRVVSGRSKQYLLRPETTLLVTLYFGQNWT